MDSIKSFKGYGKVDELQEQEFRRKTRKRLIILILSSILLVAIIIGAVAGTVIHRRNKNSDETPSSPANPSAALKSICNSTQFPDSCFNSISALESSDSSNPEQIFNLSLRVVLNELTRLSSLPGSMASRITDEKIKRALAVCDSVFDDAIDSLNESISAVDSNGGRKLLTQSTVNDLRSWLSAAITDQETCLDALEELNSTQSKTVLEELRSLIKNSTEFSSNSLAIVTKILGVLAKIDIPIHRKLLGASSDSEFPEWIRAADRRLLQETVPAVNLTVAADGSGDYKTIQEAVARVPKKSKSRFVIYVKTGVYMENVNLEKHIWNVMMFGDGKGKTIVSGSLNFIDGVPTFSTATVAAVGRGFMAKDMTFRNTAGPEKHQAVAFRSGSDQSVFYRCSFEAFQDTLYAHSNRQFYRDCDVTGTIDFIFGNAAVVFQNCNIQPRQPLSNQFVTITAQGKKDVNQNTGISIQKCSITALDKLTAPTYLGRPWKQFSTTVIMQSSIGDFLNPLGWIEWVRNVDPPETIFYAEYLNTGPGSAVEGRVRWAGYRPTITPDQASKFTVQSFIEGADWLPQTAVAFQTSL